MRLFITGATGFVGSHVVLQGMLDHQVVASCRSRSEPRVEWPTLPTFVIHNTLSEITHDDLYGTDVVIHLAAHTANRPYDDLNQCILYNVLDPLVLLSNAYTAGVRKFVIAGSYFEYGTYGERVDRVPVFGGLEPTSSYATSKAMATLAFQQFARDHEDIEMTILRLSQVYGPGEGEKRLWSSLVKAAKEGTDLDLTGGDQIRDFVDVGHVTSVILHAAREQLRLPGAVIRNVGSGEAQTMRSFAESWWRKLGATGKLNFGAKPYSPDEIFRCVPLC